MKWSASDHEYMALAIRLAGKGRYSCQPNPRVGCVIVNDGRIVGSGSHMQAGREHAEILALQQAGDAAKGATCYITLEPCVHTGRTPPCTDALIKSGVSIVHAAMVDPNPRVDGRGISRLRESGIQAHSGLLENGARQLNRGFIKRMLKDRPYVRCKLAMSLDGKTALASARSKWITGGQARHDVQKLRAASCAIMTGIGTILADDPGLDVREVDTLGRQPLRVIIDRHLRIPDGARALKPDGNVLVFTTEDKEDREQLLQANGVKVVTIKNSNNFLDECLHYLAEKHEINELLVEAGAGLSGAFIEAGLVDELVLYQAPMIMGDTAISLFAVSEVTELADSYRLNLVDVRNIGDDLRLTYTFNS